MDTVQLVLCPECGVISPVDQSADQCDDEYYHEDFDGIQAERVKRSSYQAPSIGLGFTSESILARNELR